jgi:hypothetical protein
MPGCRDDARDRVLDFSPRPTLRVSSHRPRSPMAVATRMPYHRTLSGPTWNAIAPGDPNIADVAPVRSPRTAEIGRRLRPPAKLQRPGPGALLVPRQPHLPVERQSMVRLERIVTELGWPVCIWLQVDEGSPADLRLAADIGSPEDAPLRRRIRSELGSATPGPPCGALEGPLPRAPSVGHRRLGSGGP